jgi:hypothetical protein
MKVRGLSTAEATERRGQVGPNALPEKPSDPLWRRFARQFNSPLIFILLFALAFDLGVWLHEGTHGWPIEASAENPARDPVRERVDASFERRLRDADVSEHRRQSSHRARGARARHLQQRFAANEQRPAEGAVRFTLVDRN